MPRARPRATSPRIVDDAVESAKLAGLTYVGDGSAGITRRRAAKSFIYLDPHGTRVRGAATLSRIRALAIPPAWTQVWISPSPDGHVQAIGRDARGRKQYRYHARWREVRDEAKYARTLAFARRLPAIRARLDVDLAGRGLPREKVLAAVVRLLELTLIRVGNAEYARQNRSFGLTTMRHQHVTVSGARLGFAFRGKSGKAHTVEVRDARLAGIVRQCRSLPGRALFQSIGADGAPQAIDAADVNAYLREIAGDDFTAKDFRTWAGTMLAAMALADSETAASKRHARRIIATAVASVAHRLGNTPAVCRNGYVHPGVIDAYLGGVTLRAFRRRASLAIAGASDRRAADEAVILGMLEQRLVREPDARAA
jgi:DNA topoisomerase-1